jgi:hypothetical protein
MASERLYFSGTRGGLSSMEMLESRTTAWQGQAVHLDFVILTSAGQGRSYRLERPDSFWRSHSELDLGNQHQVRQFVRRWGDPLGELGSVPHVNVSRWEPIQLSLRAAAEVWSAEDDDGLSHCDATRTKAAARALVDVTPATVWAQTTLRPSSDDPRIPEHHAQSLWAFMLLSALSDLRNANTMRRCIRPSCRTWFTLRRVGALYCSQSCNVQALNAQAIQKGAQHGHDPQEDDSSRNHDLSGRVDRAGNEWDSPATR